MMEEEVEEEQEAEEGREIPDLTASVSCFVSNLFGVA